MDLELKFRREELEDFHSVIFNLILFSECGHLACLLAFSLTAACLNSGDIICLCCKNSYFCEVDGHVKCEKWIRDDNNRSEEWKATWWLNRLIGRKKKVAVDWPYPFAEGKLFVLTISAGLEGYHVSVDGRHVTSFPYRTVGSLILSSTSGGMHEYLTCLCYIHISQGFALEDATGLSINGDVDVHSIFAASLPTSHPSFAPQMHLELLPQWKAPPLHNVNVDLFIGILSAGNHFAERMAVRKSWMQHRLIKSSHVVARFFVALVKDLCIFYTQIMIKKTIITWCF